jgi:hypothetical protein
MLRLGATASDSHMTLCRELEKMFRRHGIGSCIAIVRLIQIRYEPLRPGVIHDRGR